MVQLMKAGTLIAIADALSFCFATAIIALMLTGAFKDDQKYSYSLSTTGGGGNMLPVLSIQPCDEIYVVGEGETIHTISEKCGDPFIVERNPHIHDPDDVFPGLVIKITLSSGK